MTTPTTQQRYYHPYTRPVILAWGDLIGVPAASNNHGCSDYAILKRFSENQAVVVEANSCSSCWQVWHDADHVFTKVGDIWEFNPDDLIANDLETFTSSVQWVLR